MSSEFLLWSEHEYQAHPRTHLRHKVSAKPLTTLKTAHEAAIKAAEITPHFRIYDLRHTFGSRLAMAGVDLATLKELMGHSNISITMRYVHPTPEHKQEAVWKMERFNASQTFRVYEGGAGSPTKVLTVRKTQSGKC